MKTLSFLMISLWVFIFPASKTAFEQAPDLLPSPQGSDSNITSTPNQRDTLMEPITGGWTPFRPLTKEEKELFASLTNGKKEKYTPLEVATQLVNGTNYCFLADATLSTPEAKPTKYVVRAHQPISGKPVLESARALFSEDAMVAMPGGWGAFQPLNAYDKETFDKAMATVTDVEYTPTEVSMQVVAGFNYRFFCNAKPMARGAAPYKAMVMIYAAPDGTTELSGVQRVNLP